MSYFMIFCFVLFLLFLLFVCCFFLCFFYFFFFIFFFFVFGGRNVDLLVKDVFLAYLNSKLDLNLSCANDLVYKLKKIVGSDNFSAQFIKIISHYKKMTIILMYCNRLHAWWPIQSRLAALLSSLVARRWVGLQTLYDGSDLKTYLLMR